jgi:glutamine synthetase
MQKTKLEYVWLDGYKPEPTLRSKVKVIDRMVTSIEEVPLWGFDGSSTQQAKGSESDCILQPVKLFKGPFESDWLVLCEVLNKDNTTHESNSRSQIVSSTEKDYWFGFEQEYTFMMGEFPLEWPIEGEPKEQGDYYCGVGASNIGKTGRRIMFEHVDNCITAGVSIHGTNAEVMLGQWEYQVFGKGGKNAADNAWMARYILYRTAEKYGIDINIEPKPIKGDWNGNGMHTNFSNSALRDQGGKGVITNICEKMKPLHKSHIAVYGSKNDERLTGLHETQHIDKFSYGEYDRGASIRVPMITINNNYKGYLEDRRPAGNADPYKVVNRIITTIEHQ